MDSIKLLTHFFLITLGFGTFIFSPIVDTKRTGAGFIKLLSTISLASLVLAYVLQFFISNTFILKDFILFFIPILSFIIVSKVHKDEKTLLMWIIYGVIVLLSVVQGFVYFNTSVNLLIFYFLTIGLLGITSYSMLLGHYYLVVPKLSERPLIVAIYFLWGFLLLKFSFSSYGAYESKDFFLEGSTKGAGYMFNWIMLTMRFLWGYVALGILSIFGYKLCRIRSIQSATGIFYVMVFFVLIGEIISAYLYFNFGLFL